MKLLIGFILANLMGLVVSLDKINPNQPAQRINLNSNWTIANQNFKIELSNQTLPTSIHTALRRAGIIEDPLYRYNDISYRPFINDDAWTFSTYFQLDNFPSLNQSSSINLILNSIDTIASVYLNGKFIAYVNNEFLKYQVDSVNKYLLDGYNLLELKFFSPANQASYLANIYPYYEPQDCPPSVQHGICHANFLRKKQCSFSWDWGPAFAPIGINGMVSLDIINSFDFDHYLSVYPITTGDLYYWLIDLDLNINSFSQISSNALVKVKIDDVDFYYSQSISLNSTKTQTNLKIALNRYKNIVNLWWPNGYGDQQLYNLTIEVNINGQSILKSKMIGFRSVELVQDPVSQSFEGLTFYFRINNLEVFLKGSNWIPADSFQELIGHDRLEWLVKSAQMANMNVLRVWGGGLYEQDYFYELCDRLGIMIWQDFMFACSLYPTNGDYLNNVYAEVTYQVNRLKSHPSIIIWSGNNENEAALSTNWYGTDTDKDIYVSDYIKLYIDVIMSIVSKHDPEQSRPFLSSSPTNGKETIAENWLAKNPYDLRYGDLHFYDYKMNGWEPSSFPLPRFMSEFGIQSLPSYSTLSDVYNMPGDAGIFSDLNQHRQHHDQGNQQIIDEIQNNLNLPSFPDPVENFKSVILLSQINQAMTLKTGSEHFRRNKASIDSATGLGKCMGTMYWQFNDLWQAPTWSSIEYVSSSKFNTYGSKWKMAHYFIKNAYAKILLSPFVNDTSIVVYAVSDLNATFKSDFNLRIFAYDSLTPKLSQTKLEFSLNPLEAKVVYAISWSEVVKQTGCELNSNVSCVLELDSDDSEVQDGNKNFLLFKNRLADVVNLVKPDLEIVDVRIGNKEGEFLVDIQTSSVSLFVWLEMDTSQFFGIFSDNGFHMTAKLKTVSYVTNDLSVGLDDVKKYLTITCLLV